MTNSEKSAEEIVKEQWPDACAVHFIGGWMIRRYVPAVPMALSEFRKDEAEAWADAASRLPNAALKESE